MTQLTKAQEYYIQRYFDAEARADKFNGTARFREVDRLSLAAGLRQMISIGEFKNLNAAAVLIAKNDPAKSQYHRHQWRLRAWSKELDGVAKPEVKAAVTEKVEPVKTDEKVELKQPTVAQDHLLFKSNLISSVKALCKSALKRDLSYAETTSILTGGLKEAAEEFSAEQSELKFAAFLRNNGIDKNTALDILQRLS